MVKITIAGPGARQSSETSFAGGAPHLPPEAAWPTCTLCGAAQSFFFQIAFPDGHAWAGRSLALFACTRCADERFCIPEMLRGRLDGATVPAAFLDAYQRNFRTLVFPTGDGVRRDGPAGVMFRPIRFGDLLAPTHGHVGGQPRWMLDPEAPAHLDTGAPFTFLFQLNESLVFHIEAEAPAQMLIGLDGSPEPSTQRAYSLFLGNRLFAFGAGADRIYLLTQI